MKVPYDHNGTNSGYAVSRHLLVPAASKNAPSHNWSVIVRSTDRAVRWTGIRGYVCIYL